MERSKLPGIRFEETMSGALGVGETEFTEGLEKGLQEGTVCRFDVTVSVFDLTGFANGEPAALDGTIVFEPLGGPYAIQNGRFGISLGDGKTGWLHMRYTFSFQSEDGRTYTLQGFKQVKDDPGFDLVDDMTTLFTSICEGSDETGPIYASGILKFELSDLPAMLGSLRIIMEEWLTENRSNAER